MSPNVPFVHHLMNACIRDTAASRRFQEAHAGNPRWVEQTRNVGATALVAAVTVRGADPVALGFGLLDDQNAAALTRRTLIVSAEIAKRHLEIAVACTSGWATMEACASAMTQVLSAHINARHHGTLTASGPYLMVNTIIGWSGCFRGVLPGEHLRVWRAGSPAGRVDPGGQLARRSLAPRGQQQTRGPPARGRDLRDSQMPQSEQFARVPDGQGTEVCSPAHASPVLIEVVLAQLVAVADEQEVEFGNLLGAKGIRYAIEFLRRHMNSMAGLLLDPAAAGAYCGYSLRHIRRVAQNYGTPKRPLYRLGELPISPGHTPRLPAALGRPESTGAGVEHAASTGRDEARQPDDGSAAGSAPRAKRTSTPMPKSATRNSPMPDIELRAIARARASRPARRAPVN